MRLPSVVLPRCSCVLLALMTACGQSSSSGGPGDGGGVTDGGAADGASHEDGASGGHDGSTSPADAANAGADGSGGGDASGNDASPPPDAGDASASCGPCDTPPDACHAKAGTCQAGICVYAFVDGAACDDGNACTVNDTCANGACSGTAIQCTTPPAPVCVSSTESVTHDAQGVCSGGLCVYTSHTTTCSGGPCESGVCSSDPCAGVTCNAPPSLCYASSGTCSGGSCSYAYADGTSCDDGNACTTGDSCDTGVCEGVPMSCNTPPASTCANATTVKTYLPSGTCSAGACSYTYVFDDCAAGCAGGACTPSGWTTMVSNTNENLEAVWGSSASAVWAVGEGGTAVFYDGTQWQVRPVPSQVTGAIFFAIHGTSASDVYALGQDSLIHYDGTSWKFVASLPNPYCSITSGVFATGDADDDAYVSCWWASSDLLQETQTLYEVSGAGVVTQIAQTSGGIECENYSGGVWAFSPTNVWLGGCPPQQWSGTALTSIGSGAPGSPVLWATGPNSVFTLDYDENHNGDGDVEFWNGATWTPLNSGLNGTLSALSGSSATRVFAAGFDEDDVHGAIVYYDGAGFTNQVLPAATPALYGIWAAATGEVFSVGADGTIVKGP